MAVGVTTMMRPRRPSEKRVRKPEVHPNCKRREELRTEGGHDADREQSVGELEERVRVNVYADTTPFSLVAMTSTKVSAIWLAIT